MFSEWYFGADLSTWSLLLEIVLAAVLVIVFGSRLATLADRVADQYHLGDAWVGALLLATVTSLPEVVSSVTATWIGQTDMAFSALFGSCSFNLVIIVLLNGWIGGGSILRGKSVAHTLSSSFGLVLISIALMGVLLVEKFAPTPRLAQACEVTTVVVIAAAYVACMRLVFHAESDLAAAKLAADVTEVPTPGILRKVALISCVLVAAAWWLARTGDVLAAHPIEWIGRPLGATFVGFLFLAAATSLPEIATSLSAVRAKNMDMALGNIFGSNMFNIFVIPWLKIASLLSGDDLLMAGSDFHAPQNLIAGVLPILLTGVVVGGLSYASRRTLLRRFGWDSGLLAAIYVLGVLLLLSSP